MPMLSFLPQFAPLVESGLKLQTIRLVRKRPIHVGDLLILATGARTPHYRVLCRSICQSVTPFHVVDSPYVCDAYWDGVAMELTDGNSLARADGFTGSDEQEPWCELRRFLTKQYGLPFRGVVIRW